ncbi:MAG: class I SAM-dependent methyltransferase [Candidatus Omnitrophota bacterium]
MRNGLLSVLKCPDCGKSSFRAEEEGRDGTEIRGGRVVCGDCGVPRRIIDGIVDFLGNPSADVLREKGAVDAEEYFSDSSGKRYKVNRESVERFRSQFLLLPEGDGSYFFRRGGCFQSIAEGAHRFRAAQRLMGLRGGEKVLSLGDGFGYASYRFAQSGCSVVALDISSYLLAADAYVAGAYFDRVFSDMHALPFADGVFDAVFCSAAMHHSRDLRRAFSEARRVLKPGGKIFLINESARGVFEKEDPGLADLNKRGYSDTAYTIPEWVRSARASGFRAVRVEFLSLADDYIARQENKGVRASNFLKIAYFLRRHRGMENLILFLLTYPRLLLRPRSWRLVCCK